MGGLIGGWFGQLVKFGAIPTAQHCVSCDGRGFNCNLYQVHVCLLLIYQSLRYNIFSDLLRWCCGSGLRGTFSARRHMVVSQCTKLDISHTWNYVLCWRRCFFCWDTSVASCFLCGRCDSPDGGSCLLLELCFLGPLCVSCKWPVTAKFQSVIHTSIMVLILLNLPGCASCPSSSTVCWGTSPCCLCAG